MSKPLTIRDLCGTLKLRNGSKRHKEMEEFLAAHQKPAAVTINMDITRGTKTTIYKAV